MLTGGKIKSKPAPPRQTPALRCAENKRPALWGSYRYSKEFKAITISNKSNSNKNGNHKEGGVIYTMRSRNHKK
ncbi:hypothetical protein DN062_03445 [Nitrincola tibetensis]|uniref:Uncharacterized protein n=1 Tax=Nitrincola tibetensis TaxID=2219697 RepID=A0A364NR10_9GAMM|nr:hypothetical protein DN062_03445 [Nitrincola tibetensis]